MVVLEEQCDHSWRCGRQKHVLRAHSVNCGPNISNIALNLVLMRKMGVAGLALSTTLVHLLLVLVIMSRLLNRRGSKP